MNLTHATRLAAAIAYLRARGIYVLDPKGTLYYVPSHATDVRRTIMRAA